MRAGIALVGLFLVATTAGCSEGTAPADEGPCPPNASMGGMCVRRTFCITPPDRTEGTPVHDRYPECPLAVRVPATEPSNVGEQAYLMAGDTCEQRRTHRDVCCYEYQTFCAR